MRTWFPMTMKIMWNRTVYEIIYSYICMHKITAISFSFDRNRFHFGLCPLWTKFGDYFHSSSSINRVDLFGRAKICFGFDEHDIGRFIIISSDNFGGLRLFDCFYFCWPHKVMQTTTKWEQISLVLKKNRTGLSSHHNKT